MNRILKKTISFLSAAAVSVSALLSGAVTAFAASDVSARQTLSNRYDMYVAFESGALYASNATKATTNDWGRETAEVNLNDNTEYVMITDKGRKVSIKNTIGFDKVYSLTTDYLFVNYAAAQAQNYSLSDCIIVGKDDKYAAILSDGTYLANGAYFNKIYNYNGYITTVSDSETVFYSAAGNQLGKIDSANVGSCVDYDKESQTFLTRNCIANSDNSWDRTYSQYIVNNGEIIASFEDGYEYLSFKKLDNTTYIFSETWQQTEYYTLEGTPTEVTLPAVEKPNLSVNIAYNDDYSQSTVTVTDKSGKVITTFKASTSVDLDKSGSVYYTTPPYLFNNGKLIISWGNFCIIDDATGKIEAQNTNRNFCGISSLNSSNQSFNLVVGEKLSSEYGDYYSYKTELYDNGGNCLSDAFDELTPTATDGYSSNYSYSTSTYPKNTSFIAEKDGLLGIVNCKGKTIVKPTYNSVYACNRAVAIMCLDSSAEYYVLSNKTGKKLLTADRTNVFTDYYFQYLQPTAPNVSYFITANKDGTRFGCVVIKS